MYKFLVKKKQQQQKTHKMINMTLKTLSNHHLFAHSGGRMTSPAQDVCVQHVVLGHTVAGSDTIFVTLPSPMTPCL